MIDSRKDLEAATVGRRRVLLFGVCTGGSNDGLVSDLGGNQRVVATHRACADRADWTRVALRAGDPGGGMHRIGREISPVGPFVFFPRRECGVHCGVQGGGRDIAPSGENRLASAIHEGCDVAAADRHVRCVDCGVRGDEVSSGRPLDSRAGILAGDDELVGWRCGGDRIDRAVFPDLCFAGVTGIPGLSGT
jgi:hypothetical protein